MMSEIVQYLSHDGLMMVNSKLPIFLETVTTLNSDRADCAWQEVLTVFEFNANEKANIEYFLHGSEEFAEVVTDIQEIDQLKQEIKECLVTQAAQFDVQVIKDYLEYLKKTTTVESVQPFASFIKKDIERIDQIRTAKFEYLIDQYKVEEEK